MIINVVIIVIIIGNIRIICTHHVCNGCNSGDSVKSVVFR